MNTPVEQIRQITAPSSPRAAPSGSAPTAASSLIAPPACSSRVLYDFDNLFGVDFSTSKEQRVNTGEPR